MKSNRTQNQGQLDNTPTGGVYAPLLRKDYDDYRNLMAQYQGGKILETSEVQRLSGYFGKILEVYNFKTGEPRDDVDLGISNLKPIPQDRIIVFRDLLQKFIDDHHDLFP